MTTKPIIILLLLFSFVTFAQEENDLLSELNAEVEVDQKVSSVFKGLKIVNLESTKLAAKKDLYFIISHRFGSVSGGAREFFGFDQSTIRFQLVYGITDWLNVGGGRSSFQKTYDLNLKYRLVQQERNGFPFTIVGFSAASVNTQLSRELVPDLEYINRLTYLSEILISSKISKSLSLEIAPILIHENFVANDLQRNTQYAIGGGGRMKISKRLSFNLDYVYHLNRADTDVFRNPLSIGVDIETGGHVFQVHLTNAQPMFDSGFITSATGDWTEGDIFFGFNLLRVF